MSASSACSPLDARHISVKVLPCIGVADRHHLREVNDRHLLVVVDQQVEFIEVTMDEALAGQAADELHACQVHLGHSSSSSGKSGTGVRERWMIKHRHAAAGMLSLVSSGCSALAHKHTWAGCCSFLTCTRGCASSMVISTAWRLLSTAWGTGKPWSPRAFMKAYSFRAASLHTGVN